MSATISEFSDGFLVAAHLLQLENPGRMLKAGEILEFSAGRRAGRTKQALDKLYYAGLIFTSDAGDDGYGPIVEEDLSLKVTDEGHVIAEQLQKDEQHRIVRSVLRQWNSIQHIGSNGASTQTIESVNWTGLTDRTLIDARNAKVVSRLIEKALKALPESPASNFEHMQAAAYLKAAKELVEAPEPPSELIWQLISKAADLVGLIGLFYTIFAQAAS